jgi:ketosteroid isomerase-like protein
MRAEAGVSGGNIMQKASILSFLWASLLSIVIVALSAPAFAQDADFKKQLEQMGAVYLERFDKQDANGVAELYATGAIIVDPAGPRTDIVNVFKSAFNAGISQMHADVDQLRLLGSPDIALGAGKYRVSGTNASGTPIEVRGIWTATFVREGGKWKVGMLTSIPQPTPAK